MTSSRRSTLKASQASRHFSRWRSHEISGLFFFLQLSLFRLSYILSYFVLSDVNQQTQTHRGVKGWEISAPLLEAIRVIGDGVCVVEAFAQQPGNLVTASGSESG